MIGHFGRHNSAVELVVGWRLEPPPLVGIHVEPPRDNDTLASSTESGKGNVTTDARVGGR